MPTPSGKETIDERLSRLRTALARVRGTIERVENNGRQWAVGGSSVTEMSYDAALRREKSLTREIRSLEARKAGTRSTPGIAQTRTRMS